MEIKNQVLHGCWSTILVVVHWQAVRVFGCWFCGHFSVQQPICKNPPQKFPDCQFQSILNSKIQSILNHKRISKALTPITHNLLHNIKLIWCSTLHSTSIQSFSSFLSLLFIDSFAMIKFSNKFHTHRSPLCSFHPELRLVDILVYRVWAKLSINMIFIIFIPFSLAVLFAFALCFSVLIPLDFCY